MIALWLGGVICFVMGMWRDYRAGVPEHVIWAAREYPTRFYVALVAGTILWPITMVGVIAKVDAERAEREKEREEDERAERARAAAGDEEAEDDSDPEPSPYFSHREVVLDSVSVYIREHVAPGDDRDQFLDVLTYAALKPCPCRPSGMAEYHERRARYFRALAAECEREATA